MLQIDGKMWQKLLKRVLFRFGIRVEQLRPRPYWSGENERFSYQSAHVKFSIRPKDKVLDIGSGAYPFPYATVLVERFIGKTEHRHDKLVTNGKPLAIANISALPFRDKHFDFVYCSHVLEHVEEPIRACAEIMRVGRRGYIETPTLAKDMLFAWAEGMHKWQVAAIANILVFFEYSKRQLQGIRSSAWKDIVLDRFYHPLQAAFYENQDIFNTMLCWEGDFRVVVFRLDGSVASQDYEISYSQHGLP
jgi:SAM-dependent methyltransferase